MLFGFRFFIIAVTGLILFLMAVRYLKLAQFFSRSLKFFMYALFSLLVAVAWDTAVLVANDDPFSWRMLPVLLALVLCVAALAETPEALQRRRNATGELNRDVQLKALKLENNELSDKLYDSLRRENKASTQLLIAKEELAALKQKRRIT